MLCSVPTRKSASGWLDRLRSSKGFPSSAAADLETFIDNPIPQQQTDPDPEPKHNPNPPPQGPILRTTQNEKNHQLYNIVSNVLCDLFNFGEFDETKFAQTEKPSRKQKNPRFCILENVDNGEKEIDNVDAEKELKRGTSNSQLEGVKVCSDNLVLKENDEEGSNGNLGLLGFSRTEVTVIDTSYKSWKFEKLLYRKKNIWKVRDKKGKSASVGIKNKRKASVEVEDEGGVKKRKVEGDGKMPVDEVYHQNDKSPAAHEKKVLKKRGGDLLQMEEKGSSSVVLIKNIPSSKRNGTSISKGSLKSKQNRP